MVNFKEKVTLENQKTAYEISKNRTKNSKIIWAIIFGIILISFLVLAIVLKTLDNPVLIYTAFGILLALVVFVNFFYDEVKFRFRQKKLSSLMEENGGTDLYVEIDFNSEHLAIEHPLFSKKGIIRIDYEKFAQVYFDDKSKVLFFLVRGDSGDYYTLFLDKHDKKTIKEACETFPNDIIYKDKLEEYLGLTIERIIVEEYNPDENPYLETNKDEKKEQVTDAEKEKVVLDSTKDETDKKQTTTKEDKV